MIEAISMTKFRNTKSLNESLSSLMHEITQSLTVINAYASGCINQLKSKDYEKNKIIDALYEVKKHTELLENKIKKMYINS